MRASHLSSGFCCYPTPKLRSSQPLSPSPASWFSSSNSPPRQQCSVSSQPLSSSPASCFSSSNSPPQMVDSIFLSLSLFSEFRSFFTCVFRGFYVVWITGASRGIGE
ncbi:hypothetical protein BHM03_00004200 [Ensete ventricosum]|uniref:Uncharacterized protein n=1 Tax=Ensete ventricosum TaxID=4639 RepID=A0A427A8B1_ENSVE|nr:hypothetical protein B296_00025305 [Ensete ventricosum]RZR71227.1 hypothetical protein BHM03_00004200 [Ensete ventricosum]